MCLWREAELNWVRTYTRRNPELMQLLTGISTMRYLPAKGTAGLERSLVRGKSRVPAPPPMTIARVFSVIEGQFERFMREGDKGMLPAGSMRKNRRSCHSSNDETCDFFGLRPEARKTTVNTMVAGRV